MQSLGEPNLPKKGRGFGKEVTERGEGKPITFPLGEKGLLHKRRGCPISRLRENLLPTSPVEKIRRRGTRAGVLLSFGGGTIRKEAFSLCREKGDRSEEKAWSRPHCGESAGRGKLITIST